MTWRPPTSPSPSPGNTALTPQLDGEMTRQDLIFELSQLEFRDHSQLRKVKMDEPVRDFIVNALSARQPRRA
jgi:hypothetical protein